MRLSTAVLFSLLLLLLAASPLPAVWTPSAMLEDLFVSQRFEALEREYARVLAARSRNRWGEFHTEEFVRRLHLSLTARSEGDVVPSQAELDARTQAWVKQSPRSTAAAIVRTNYLLQRADALYRAQKWPAADAMTREARALLLQARAASRSDPNWHTAWLYLGMLQGWDPQEVMEAIEEAAAHAEPAAAGPWLVAAAALSPDGRGAGLLLPLAELAVRKTRDTEGWGMYGRIYLHAAQSYGAVRTDPFHRGGVDWWKMNAALIDLYSRYSSPAVLNQHAILACLAGERAATAALLARIGPNPYEAWWNYWGGPPLYERCKAWASRAST